MPELPDVEFYRQYLNATSLHQPILEVEVMEKTILHQVTPRKLRRTLRGHAIESSRRHGKYLFGALDSKAWLVFHFGMTGNLKYFRYLRDEPEYTKVRFDFKNGYHLSYISIRKLGFVGLIQDPEDWIRRKDLGPDALEITKEEFLTRMESKRGYLKFALMDQSTLAGVGNIYSDEILFQAGLNPNIRVPSLSTDTLEEIFWIMKEVLNTAVKVSAETGNLPPKYIIPHREKEGTCPKCGHPLQRATIGGRTAYYCPEHQAMGRELERLQEQVRTCTRCDLSTSRTHAVPGEGPQKSRILFIGEAPGAQEDVEGRPFVGRAGRELEKLLNSILLRRSEVYITSVVKCHPPENRNPKREEIEACLPYLKRQIQLVDPKILVPMGRYATTTLFRILSLEPRPIGDVHGTAQHVSYKKRERVVLPTYHPAVVTHNPSMRDSLKKDFRALAEVIHEGEDV
jgi:formamidopyrimidine-DNA glycosylase